MKNRTRIFLALTLVSLLFSQLASAAQARWEDVVRAAEKEGEVSVYATNSVGELTVIWDAFKKKFPKIKLTAVPISTTSDHGRTAGEPILPGCRAWRAGRDLQ